VAGFFGVQELQHNQDTPLHPLITYVSYGAFFPKNGWNTVVAADSVSQKLITTSSLEAERLFNLLSMANRNHGCWVAIALAAYNGYRPPQITVDFVRKEILVVY
jgi:hypothetical protein